MIHLVRWVLEHGVTLGILCFLLISVPVFGIMIIYDPD